jgi:2-phosphosulfolactate phosphatase
LGILLQEIDFKNSFKEINPSLTGRHIQSRRSLNSIVLHGPSDWSSPTLQLPPHTLAVVIDVLRATSTIAAAFSVGVREIRPVSTLEEAFEVQKRFPNTRLAGERGGRRMEGFDFGNSPQEFLSLESADFNLVILTTNGTRALLATGGAEEVVAASFLNREAVLQKIRSWSGPVAYFCAGTGDDFSLEDSIVASDFLAETDPQHPYASLYRFTRKDLRETFRQSKNGSNLVRIEMEKDIDLCLEIDRLSVLPHYDPREKVIRLRN